MNDFSAWLAANDRYLIAALGWLRARLERLAAQAEPLEISTAEIPQVIEPAEQPRSFFRRLFGLRPKQAATAQEMWPGGQELESEARLPSSDATMPPSAMIDAEAAEHPPALVLLSHRLGLSAFER